MNKYEVKYKPYAIFSILSCMFVIATVMLVGFSIFNYKRRDYFVVFMICMLWLTFFILLKTAIDYHDITLCFDDVGIRITNRKLTVDEFLTWQNLSYGYYKIWWGHIYLVLAERKLTTEELKEYVSDNISLVIEKKHEGIMVIFFHDVKKAFEVSKILVKNNIQVEGKEKIPR